MFNHRSDNRSETRLVKPPDSQGPAKWSPSPEKGSTGTKLFKQNGNTDFTGWPWQQGQTGNQRRKIRQPDGCTRPTGIARSQAALANQPRPLLSARAGRSLAESKRLRRMLKDCRCGKCKRLLARIGEMTELQIKCARCGTLNHVRATCPELSPMSDMNAEFSAKNHSTQGNQNVQ